MNVLVGPSEHERFSLESASRHSVRRFDWPPARGPLNWSSVLRPADDGWRPDAVVWTWPEYAPWPALEACPIPLIAVVGDWHLNWSVLSRTLASCDWIVADKRGVGQLRALGYRNCSYWAAYAYAGRPREFPTEPPRYDISFIGRLNFHIHRRRARILAQVARLSERYRVLIRKDIFGEEYFAALAGSRIVINEGLRGEMNLRAYEAPACGALLFMDRENLEARDFLNDRAECVYYGEADLTALLEFYLRNEPLRRTVALAGHERLKSATAAAHFTRLLDELSTIDWGRRESTRWNTVAPAERFYQAGRWFALAGSLHGPADVALKQAAVMAPENIGYLNGLAVWEVGCAYACGQAGRTAEADSYLARAEERWRRVLSSAPDHVLARANWGLALALLGRNARAAEILAESLDRLARGETRGLGADGFPLMFEKTVSYMGVPIPDNPSVTTFRVEWERLAATNAGDEGRAIAGARDLLAWRCACKLGELLANAGDAAGAARRYEHATQVASHLEEGWIGLSDALKKLGRLPEAAEALAAALRCQPWDFIARVRLVELLVQLGADAAANALAAEGLALNRSLS